MESKTRRRYALVAIRRVFRRGFTCCGGRQICRCGKSQSTAMYRHREYQRSSAQLKRRKSRRRCNNSWISAMSRTDPIGFRSLLLKAVGVSRSRVQGKDGVNRSLTQKQTSPPKWACLFWCLSLIRTCSPSLVIRLLRLACT